MLGPLGLGQESAPGSGLGHAPPLLPPWAPEKALRFHPDLMAESSRLLVPGPQSVSVQAADWAVLGAPLDTEVGESQGEPAAEDCEVKGA